MKNRVKEKEIIPALLNIKEFCDYLGIGETKARELLHDPGEWLYCEDRESAVRSQGKSGSVAVKTTVYLIYMRTYRV